MASLGDTIFHMTEWLRTTPLVDFSLWLGNSETVEWIQSHFFMVPLMQMVHILAIAMGFGSVLMFNLRLLGVTGAGRTIPQVLHRYLPWMWWALLVLFISGIGMLLGDPLRLLVNPVFWMKMGLFVLVLLVSIIHQSVVIKKIKAMAAWDPARGGQLAIRASAVGVILLWLCIMVGGRFMAYAPM